MIVASDAYKVAKTNVMPSPAAARGDGLKMSVLCSSADRDRRYRPRNSSLASVEE
jgi:hypothetical protein